VKKQEISQSLDNIYFVHSNAKTNFNQKLYKKWLSTIANNYNKKIVSISYCFMDDEELLEVNKIHLQHDYYTDIITFQLNEMNEDLIADIYISITRVKENAIVHKTSISEELRRVIAHGLLHLIGFKDKIKNDQLKMREAEESALSLYHKIYQVSRENK
jgi:rRNA maturation RNase YbeY